MLVCFGFSWPANIAKSYKARTTQGKSLLFLIFVIFGYFCGIMAKILSASINYVIVFYIINIVMVIADLCLYFRNRAIDRRAKPA
jgi:hypothetical protein